MYIYDFKGTQIRNIIIVQREYGNNVIQGSELDPGIYIYSLIADGWNIGTEQMILTN